MYRVNVSNLVYAVNTKDDATGVTYGAIKPLPGIMKVAMTPGVASGRLYGDGVPKAEKSKLTSVEVLLDVNKIPLADRADIMGQTVTAGTIEDSITDVAPYIALGFKIEHDDGTAEFVWLYKGRATPITDEAEQTTENIKYSTQSLKLLFIPRVNDGKLRKFGDSSDATFTEEATWFNAVPAPVAG